MLRLAVAFSTPNPRFFESVAMGVSITKSGRSRGVMLAEAAIFSVATPAGALLGPLARGVAESVLARAGMTRFLEVWAR